MRARTGASVLVIVILFAVIAGVMVFAYHQLWRGSSRTLFSAQELRVMTNLGRSSLSETYYELQKELDHGGEEWFDWCTAIGSPPPRTFVPAMTRENADVMSPEGGVLRYTTGDVEVRRVARLDLQLAGSGHMGVIDLVVEVAVNRDAPKHAAKLVLAERRNFWFADQLGPYGAGGRHIEVLPTPVGTWIEGD
jgi:hypothetical protein